MLQSLIGAALLASLSSCAFHVHVHEAPRQTVVAAAEPVHDTPAPAHVSAHESRPHSSTISGFVVDTAGEPVRARIAIVSSSGGSTSSTTNDAGRFDLESPQRGPFAIHASTEDGRIAISPARGGDEGVRLVLAPGGTVTIDFTSEQKMRCAVFHGDLRIEDFTLRAKADRRSVVVPTGDIHVQVYGGGKSPSGGPGYTNDHRVTIAQGETKTLRIPVAPFGA